MRKPKNGNNVVSRSRKRTKKISACYDSCIDYFIS